MMRQSPKPCVGVEMRVDPDEAIMRSTVQYV